MRRSPASPLLSASVALAWLAYAPLIEAQVVRPAALPVAVIEDVSPGELTGLVQDDKGHALSGAIISAVGRTTVTAVTDAEGGFALRKLVPGPYLVRAHLQGYQPARGRILQIGVGGTQTWRITLTRRDAAARPVQSAGIGATSDAEPAAEQASPHEHGEIAWRLRHLKRSVLKDATQIAVAGAPPLEPDPSVWRESLSGLGRMAEGPAWIASALFADLSVDGQVNLLTTTTLDRPLDLLSANASLPRGVALMSLEVPGRSGVWRMRGALTQRDLSSWLVSGAYAADGASRHAYGAAFTYGAQRFVGAGRYIETGAPWVTPVRPDSRSVSTLAVHDTWTVAEPLRVSYGADFTAANYLTGAGLFSPRAAVSLRPVRQDGLTLRALASRRVSAPGAIEFQPPSGSVWLLPERTFSSLDPAGAFRPQRVDHVEIAADRAVGGGVAIGVRAFRQRGANQVATLFGASRDRSPASLGHYFVGSAGDFDARGWGVRATRAVGQAFRASLDYVRADATWAAGRSDRAALARLAGATVREVERLHDLVASVDTRWAPTGTRVFVLYKLTSSLARDDARAAPAPGARFDVQVTQGLPFGFTSTRWEALVAVRNVFNDDVLNGSLYDELLVVRPPTRVLGGVSVKF